MRRQEQQLKMVCVLSLSYRSSECGNAPLDDAGETESKSEPPKDLTDRDLDGMVDDGDVDEEEVKEYQPDMNLPVSDKVLQDTSEEVKQHDSTILHSYRFRNNWGRVYSQNSMV